MVTHNLPDKDTLAKVIEEEMNRQIEYLVRTAVGNAQQELERKIPELVAGLLIRGQRHINMESLRDELIVHIKWTI